MHQSVQTEEVIELGGDWTIAGIGNQLAKLRELMNGLPGSISRLTIDCAGTVSIDLYGYQILTVWICCLQGNDISLQFLDFPDEVGKALRRIRFDNRTSGMHFMGQGHGTAANRFGRCDITV